MKAVNSKATLSKSAKEIMSSRDTAREMFKLVIKSQASPTGGVMRSKSGLFIMTERPAKPSKPTNEQ